MNSWRTIRSVVRTLALALTMAVCAAKLTAMQPGDATNSPALQAKTAAEVKGLSLDWLANLKTAPELIVKASQLWDELPADATGADVLDALVATFAMANEQAAQLSALCAVPRQEPLLPDTTWMDSPQLTPFERDHLRLYFGRWLVHEKMYDEAALQLSGIKPEDVVDPASLLFYQSVVYHRLLDRESGLASVNRLLHDVAGVPARYQAIAAVIEHDLEGLQDESLDHISRRMEDIRRRLELGRAGPQVREKEQGVVDSLDKLIKQLEQQQQQQQAAANAQQSEEGSNQPSGTPAQDSRILGGKGPGEVDERPIGHRDGWGNLPPRLRDEAMQQIGKDFPAHYRDVIEQYFRKLAGEEEQPPP